MPTRDELLEIVGMNTAPPRIDPIFGPMQATDATDALAVYWSSTEVGSNGAYAVSFFNGGAGNFVKVSQFPVRAVRAGP